MSVAILVPVLGRPWRVRPLLDAVCASTPGPYAVYFLPDQDDAAEIRAIAAAGGNMLHTGAEGYARKLNAAVPMTDEPLLFLGADDIVPQEGWLEAARARMVGRVQVVGVNDLIERRPDRVGHATHFLVSRAYAELPAIDGTRGPLPECYDHSFCDDELIGTARKRGVYVYAEESHVKHEHPMAGGQDDATYRKGRARFRWDRKLFLRRRRLWT